MTAMEQLLVKLFTGTEITEGAWKLEYEPDGEDLYRLRSDGGVNLWFDAVVDADEGVVYLQYEGQLVTVLDEGWTSESPVLTEVLDALTNA